MNAHQRRCVKRKMKREWPVGTIVLGKYTEYWSKKDFIGGKMRVIRHDGIYVVCRDIAGHQTLRYARQENLIRV